MKKVIFGFLAVVVLFITGCLSSEQWEGYVYPDKKILCFVGRVVSLKIWRNAKESPWPC